MMKKYLETIRDLTDKMLFGDMLPDEWERHASDYTIIYMGSAFLVGAGVRFPDSLSDAGHQAFGTILQRYLGTVDSLALEAKNGIDSPLNFKSRVLLTTLGIRSCWLIGREISNGGVYNPQVDIQYW